MKMKKASSKAFSLILCAVLSAAMALTFTGCNENKNVSSGTVMQTASAEATVLGQGEKQFAFNVTDKDGNVTCFDIRTDKTIVGDALSELGLIEGEDGEFGLYVKTVNGITADFDKDKVYWAFYINDEYAMTGVDVTEITEGDIYSFRCES